MQGLLEQHNRRVVSGGQFNGLVFSELDQTQLKKAARRYPSDAKLQKFAKAKLAILEIEGGSEPLPCVPVRPQPAGEVKDKSWKNLLHGWLQILGACGHQQQMVESANFDCVPCDASEATLLFDHGQICSADIQTVHAKIFRLDDDDSGGVFGLNHISTGQADKRRLYLQICRWQNCQGTALHLVSHGFSALVGVSFSLIASYMQSRRGQVA